jgi:hypothetical protein
MWVAGHTDGFWPAAFGFRAFLAGGLGSAAGVGRGAGGAGAGWAGCCGVDVRAHSQLGTSSRMGTEMRIDRVWGRRLSGLNG